MADTKVAFQQLVADTSNEKVTKVWVYVENLSRDGMVGVEGWHFKEFDAELSLLDVIVGIKESREGFFPLLWPLGSPPDLRDTNTADTLTHDMMHYAFTAMRINNQAERERMREFWDRAIEARRVPLSKRPIPQYPGKKYATWRPGQMLFSVNTEEFPGSVRVRSVRFQQEVIPAAVYTTTMFPLLDLDDPMVRDLLFLGAGEWNETVAMLYASRAQRDLLRGVIRGALAALAAFRVQMKTGMPGWEGSGRDENITSLMVELDRATRTEA